MVEFSPFGKGIPLSSCCPAQKHRNKDIIHEQQGYFNAYFRQNAKLDKMAGGQSFFCAKHTKISG
jgi:hypothetical protein